MYRLLVALLAAVDALVAAAVGVAVALAPLTLLWVFGMGVPEWNALWPVASLVWQFGHAVELNVALAPDYVALAGIPAGGEVFVLSLAPLAFAVFTAIFAARSGRRAARAGAAATGVMSATAVFAALAAAIAMTSATDIVSVSLPAAIVFPALFYAIPATLSAIATAWDEDDGGLIARLKQRCEGLGQPWAAVPALAVRGIAIVVVALIGVGALAVSAMAIVRGPQVLALYQSTNVDLIGAVVLALGQLAYLPTLIVWAVAFIAGPGFSVGVGSAVSPAGTQVGVVPGIPIMGLLPEHTSTWWLALALIPIAAGAFAGWVVRTRLVSAMPPRSADPYPVLSTITALIAVVSGALASLAAVLASGALGPGRLSEVGPTPGAVAIAVTLEVALGCGILLLSPRKQTPAPAALD